MRWKISTNCKRRKKAGIHKEVVAVSKQLNEWCDGYYREAERERSFTENDFCVVKTYGLREYFCGKAGKQKQTQGNIYLHHLTKCLVKYDKSYSAKMVRVPRCTAEKVSKIVLAGYKKKGMKIL